MAKTQEIWIIFWLPNQQTGFLVFFFLWKAKMQNFEEEHYPSQNDDNIQMDWRMEDPEKARHHIFVQHTLI